MVLPRIGVDVEDVLAAAATKWNFHRHTPGIGVGGHCIPVDPYYYVELANNVGFPSLLASSSRKINSGMPEKSAEHISKILGSEKNSRVLILGYSYKANVGDTRETPVKELAKHLKNKGHQIIIHDPMVGQEEIPEWAEYISEPSKCEDLDIIVLATNHQEYNFSNEDFWESMITNTKKSQIYDGRRDLPRKKMEEKGWVYYGVGST